MSRSITGEDEEDEQTSILGEEDDDQDLDDNNVDSMNDYFNHQMEGYHSNGNDNANGHSNLTVTNSEGQNGNESTLSLQYMQRAAQQPPLVNHRNHSYGNDDNRTDANMNPLEEGDRGEGIEGDETIEDQEEENELLPAARQHTYLPGTTNPLYPEQWLQPSLSSSLPTSPAAMEGVAQRGRFEAATSATQTSSITSDFRHGDGNKSSTSLESTAILPILQLKGIVLFPNSTLPLRLKHRSWINHLSRQIAFARDGGIGMTHLNNSHESSSSSSRTRPNPIIYNFGGNDKLSNRDIQVRIGILTQLETGTRRRRILLRGTNRNLYDPSEESIDSESTVLQQQQQQQQQQQHHHPLRQSEENEITRTSEIGNADDDSTMRDFRMGRWNLQMLRRGVIGRNGRSTNSRRGFSEMASNGSSGGGSASHGSAGRRDVSLPMHERFLHPIHPNSSPPIDPLVNRIGTLATITYTHEDDVFGTVRDSDDNENSNRTMIVTALTTGRIRIIRRAEGQNDDGQANHNECQLYHVEEIIDDNIRMPSIKSKHMESSIDPDRNDGIDSVDEDDAPKESTRSDRVYYNEHRRMVRNLSKTSPIPGCALNRVWPWKLSEDILHEIASNEALHGLLENLPKSSGRVIIESKLNIKESAQSNTDLLPYHNKGIQYCIDRSQFDPVSFSYWVAANLPLSESDKLDILEMNHIERLRFLLDNLIKQRHIIRYIKCKHCGSKIARMGELFTVAGAEGTSGAYVNEYGSIHQTVTVKSVQQGSTICMGDAETKDSWFPGYSWTILCCQFCYGHLGWKFTRVSKKGNAIPTFWGLSGSNITTGKWRLGM